MPLKSGQNLRLPLMCCDGDIFQACAPKGPQKHTIQVHFK